MSTYIGRWEFNSPSDLLHCAVAPRIWAAKQPLMRVVISQGIKTMAETIKKQEIEGSVIKTELQFNIEDFAKVKSEEPVLINARFM